jgi:hypothetical protein
MMKLLNVFKTFIFELGNTVLEFRKYKGGKVK